MKRKIYSIFMLLLIVGLINSAMPLYYIYAEDIEYLEKNTDLVQVEQKVICDATLDDDFADDRVLVVLNHEESMKFKSYSNADFIEVGCNSVLDLTSSTETIVKAKTEGCKNELTNAGNSINQYFIDNVDINTYNKVLCLELKTSGKANILKVIKKLEERSEVLYAGPDYPIYECSTTPNDTYYGRQWAINKIQLPKAWDVTTGSNTVTVGVIDSGIHYNHEDLKNKIDGTLCMDYSSGKSEHIYTTTDGTGHGTHVAGIIGACTNNGTGVAGVCWNIKLVSLRVLDDSGRGYSSYAANAINHAAEKGIQILNMSVGWTTERYNKALDTVIRDYGGLVVCAVGNDKKNVDTNADYPSKYNLDNLISVGNSNENDKKYSTSNYGKTTVDLFAPGTDIWSCVPNGTYESKTGTSMAAPYVTGVAALILSEHSDYTPAQIKKTILGNVDSIGDLSNYCVSGGRLNAYKAVTDANLVNHIHSYAYTNKSVSAGHTARCRTCNKTFTEAHTWVTSSTYYRCAKCGCTTYAVPADSIVDVTNIDSNKFLHTHYVKRDRYTR